MHRLQMLTSLTLPENIFLAAFLEQCHSYIQSRSNSYIALNPKKRISSVYDESKQCEFQKKLRQILKKDPSLNLHKACQQDVILTTDDKWSDIDLSKHYRNVFIPLGYHQSLIIHIDASESKQGFLIFSRDRHDKPFTQSDINTAKKIRDAFKTGLMSTDEKHALTTSGWRSGLIIVDNRGEISSCCAEGQNLLTLALQKKPDNIQHNMFIDVRNLPGVPAIIENALDLRIEASTNETTVSSVWGDFLVTGFPVIDHGGKRSPQVYLNITWLVPFALRLFNNIQHMGITPRQQLIALLYASGSPTKVIANSLTLSLYTVKEHIQHVFEKLGIHTRAELIEQIICLKNEGASEELTNS
jgi:DNA-binding CsgD family transcriptional regulator